MRLSGVVLLHWISAGEGRGVDWLRRSSTRESSLCGQEYVQLRKPFVLNDLGMQRKLLDRREVYRLLAAAGVPVPRHVVYTRTTDSLVEGEDYIEVCLRTWSL